ncbi:MAG TPA: RNA polymerase sigma-54 factor [Chloroflexi bacterium]|nr:RNA polymerase sigma-54 factor [Chloroflexota bacterium]
MRLRQVLDQRLTVTPQLVMANALLQLSLIELEEVVTQQLAENPALELVQEQHCPTCGRAVSDGYCPLCGRFDPQVEGESLAGQEYPAGSMLLPEYDVADERDDGTWLSRLASSTTLSDHLLRQARLSFPSRDLAVVAYLVESLDDRGYLCCDLDEVAALFGLDRTYLDKVVSTLQELDPVGIAAKDARECLLIQLDHLCREGVEQPLARSLVRDHWEALGTQSLAEIARAAGATVKEVGAALQFIRSNLNPFPGYAHWASQRQTAPQRVGVYPRPDIVIRAGSAGGGFEIDLPEARTYKLRISPGYLEAMRSIGEDRHLRSERDWEQWEALRARARLLIKSVEQRWRTLRCLAFHLIECQRDFLAYGDKHLRPLTRAQLAERMGVHESTVSRAVAGKFVQLPCGRIIPLSRFFDHSVPVKELIKELVAEEDKPLSDREIAERLAHRGYRVARRTVTKYRNELNIPRASLRQRSRELLAI